MQRYKKINIKQTYSIKKYIIIMQIYIPDIKEEIILSKNWSFVPIWRNGEIKLKKDTLITIVNYNILNNNRDSSVKIKTLINDKLYHYNVKLTDINRLFFNRKETDGVLNLKLNFYYIIKKSDIIELPIKLSNHITYVEINNMRIYRIESISITTKKIIDKRNYNKHVVDKIKYRLIYIGDKEEIIVGEWSTMHTIKKKAKEYLKNIDLSKYFDKYQKEIYYRFTRKEKLKNVIID
jgi:hypothetical protein